MKTCGYCSRQLDDNKFPPAGENAEFGITLSGGVCWACVRAYAKHMGWVGFQPHGRPPGVLIGNRDVTL